MGTLDDIFRRVACEMARAGDLTYHELPGRRILSVKAGPGKQVRRDLAQLPGANHIGRFTESIPDQP